MIMKLNITTKIKQLIHVHDNDTNEDYFLMAKDNEWVKITQKEYKKIYNRGKKDDE